MAEAEIIPLYQPVATCPECQGQTWFIHVDGFKDNFENITMHECANCGFTVKLTIVLGTVKYA